MDETEQKTLRRNNKSGYTGVSFDPARGKYQVRATIGRQSFFLGYYNNAEYGSLVYKEFVKQHKKTT